MNDEKEKYSNGKPIDVATLSKEEKLKAIEYWAEGNQELKKLLLYCDDKEIGTRACCAGHGTDCERKKANNAYIAFEFGKPNDDIILNLLAKLEEQGIDTRIGFIRGRNGKNICMLHAREVRRK